MALRFFADHCVSNQIIDALREAGHEVVLLRDYLPTESPDALVVAKAQETVIKPSRAHGAVPI